MMIPSLVRCGIPACVSAMLLFGGGISALHAQSRTQLVVGVTDNVNSYNPIADSAAFMASVWCQVYGCLVTYDYQAAAYKGMLVERWEVLDPTTWVFHLRRDARSHDGQPLTAADVVFSIDRMKNDKASAKRAQVAPLKSVEAIDPHTVRMVTHGPTADLLEYLTDHVLVMQKRLIESHGDRDADRNHPFGFGPYRLKELAIGSHVVLEKDPNARGLRPGNPDVLIYRVMREPEQRITALLNGEIQIAQFVPPHLASRIEASSRHHIITSGSIEMMFLAMMPKRKPWDSKELRQAVAYAIDREAIIKTVLQGQGRVLHGPLSRGQYAYDPNLEPKYSYDPEKARALVKQAGYPNGVDVELFTPVGRYINDKQVSEAMVAMLRAVGIRAALKTPEWPTLWTDVQKGRVPFYYMGRGLMISGGPAISQYFETDGSPRIGYSNPAVDDFLRQSRGAFDQATYVKAINRALSLVLEDAPAHFLWQHNILYGVSNDIKFTPQPDHRVFGHAVLINQK
jgi:peptide/nickel transport system substrate-binding protein